MTAIVFPYVTKALRVQQRLGTFYVAVLPAELLLQVAASDSMRAIMKPDGDGYELKGTQRLLQDKRLTEISHYINRVDSAFPNSIIIAANYDLESGFDQGELEYISEETTGAPVDDSRVWSIEAADDGCYTLTIPTAEKLAAIIDGQHRLFSFARAEKEAMESMDLLCSIFIDLPKALQAQIFATINSNQKKVDRSLTYELFGYNVSDEDETYWTPDKLAVFFTRKLATDPESPLSGRIMVAPKRDKALEELAAEADWKVSTAVVVDGVLRLFSSNPKRDANAMRKGAASPRGVLSEGPKDKSPLRDVYIEGNDALIFKMVLNYLKACERTFWATAKPDSFILRTIGVQAVFDILRQLAGRSYDDRNISEGYFVEKLTGAGEINFAEDRFKNPSGSGRTVIRKAIEAAIFVGEAAH
ncbi:DNA phosphorothioation-associated DGQHR protein 1 [Salipiger profundus]|uniref:DNA phosphorothioation-associated DGQHR protein 1 n=1 Tax=Salipiger profundus TaxID=1229727 RepID=UPI0008EE7F8A|nr:DNA phosphorothioation-associated DGQHR protein 1 [Salipiger profundus]SFD95133.1 DNA phosphorothioation-associated DGQHR protein 1 [Salipiger profundus]